MPNKNEKITPENFAQKVTQDAFAQTIMNYSHPDHVEEAFAFFELTNLTPAQKIDYIDTLEAQFVKTLQHNVKDFETDPELKAVMQLYNDGDQNTKAFITAEFNKSVGISDLYGFQAEAITAHRISEYKKDQVHPLIKKLCEKYAELSDDDFDSSCMKHVQVCVNAVKEVFTPKKQNPFKVKFKK